jgi:Cu-Zn family superoxide dismutase
VHLGVPTNKEHAMHIKRMLGVAVAGAVITATGVVAMATASGADKLVARATLIDTTGAKVGSARFTVDDDGIVTGRVKVNLPVASPEFHGLHLHANAAGSGCVVGGGFTEVGGHWDVGGHTHGSHTGDLPSLVRQSDGRADVTFRVDKFAAAELAGKAVIVHAGPDNFGNIPLGPATNQYTDNGTAYNGTGGTAATGNAGARFACGVIAVTSK